MATIENDPEALPSAEDFPPPLRKRRSKDDDEMDITPMIDITFLLLIFFLVASTPDQQTAITLPEAQHGKAVSQLTATIFTVAEGGLDLAPLYNADGKIPGFELPNDLDQRNAEIEELVRSGLLDKNKTDVVIKADQGVAFREIDRVIKAVSKVEGVKLHLAVLETE